MAPAAPLPAGRGAIRDATPIIMRLTKPTVIACRVAPCQACENGRSSRCDQNGPTTSIASETASQDVRRAHEGERRHPRELDARPREDPHVGGGDRRRDGENDRGDPEADEEERSLGGHGERKERRLGEDRELERPEQAARPPLVGDRRAEQTGQHAQRDAEDHRQRQTVDLQVAQRQLPGRDLGEQRGAIDGATVRARWRRSSTAPSRNQARAAPR